MADSISKTKSGILYLVGTPIGNLSDMSPRALQVISDVAIVAAEDTRRTGMLLVKFKMKKQMESYHEHNKAHKGPLLISKLKAGTDIALVSDAGMPCISDPGTDLVKLCSENDISVVVIPGPCAAIAGLSGSDLNTARFAFEGFIPVSGKDRKARLKSLESEPRTMVFYEAPHRIKKTLTDFAKTGWQDRRITLARELTKIHEEFIRTTVGEATALYTKIDPRGEYVLAVEGREEYDKRVVSVVSESDEKANADNMETFIKLQLDEKIPVKEIAVLVSEKFSIPKRDAYSLAQEMKDNR
jgi:16S rRNA (cytidine1402-2'-O)-methyltransferase